jgi:hypothetical protein
MTIAEMIKECRRLYAEAAAFERAGKERTMTRADNQALKLLYKIARSPASNAAELAMKLDFAREILGDSEFETDKEWPPSIFVHEGLKEARRLLGVSAG